MSKQEFLNKLRKGLSWLPNNEIEERLLFYGEIIDDYIENGLLEEEAVLKVGSVDKIVKQVIEETSFIKIAKQRIKPKEKQNAVQIILLVLGSPIWISLIIAFFAVVISLYASLWAVVVSLWAVEISFIAGVVGGMLASIVFAVSGYVSSSLAMLSAGLVCAGLSIFAFYGLKIVTNFAITLSKKFVMFIKNCFIKKGAV